MGAINGDQFLKRVNSRQTEIWIDGKKVKDKVSEHPAFKGILHTKSTLYDMQVTNNNEMTYLSPITGESIGLSFLQPKTKKDLINRRTMMEKWAQSTAGMLGRSPDYLNTVIMSLASSAHLLTGKENCFPENIQSIYEMAREKDLTFTHTFITPQVNRSQMYLEATKEPISARIIDRNNKGIVIKGARLLATQGGLTDEVLIFGAPKYCKEEAFACSIPSDSKGLKFICRESFVGGDSTIDYPLSSQFEEMDSIIVFDHVLVPWDRVFYYNNLEVANSFLAQSTFQPFALHQVLTRQIVKMEFIIGLAESLIQTIDVGEYQHIHEKMADMICCLEAMKALVEKAENDAEITESGILVPNIIPLRVANLTFSKSYSRFGEIIQLIGASGLVSLPTEKSFHSSIGKDLEHYLQAANKSAIDRNKLFRLAWDLTMSAFGTRQTQYERYFFGDPIRLSSALYHIYPIEEQVKIIHDFLHIKET